MLCCRIRCFFAVIPSCYYHTKAKLPWANLSGANLTGANLDGAVRADFAGALNVSEKYLGDALAIALPSIHVYEGGPDVQTQHGLQVSLHKVKFAETETQIFLTVKNNVKEGASFYEYNVKALQGMQEFYFDFIGLSYPEVQSELLPGVESSGVVVLPVMDPILKTLLYMHSNTSNGNLIWERYVFVVPAK